MPGLPGRARLINGLTGGVYGWPGTNCADAGSAETINPRPVNRQAARNAFMLESPCWQHHAVRCRGLALRCWDVSYSSREQVAAAVKWQTSARRRLPRKAAANSPL